MPLFKVHFEYRTQIDEDDIGLEFPDLNHAYLEARKAIPDVAREMLLEGKNPLACAFIICDGAGVRLLEIPFEEALSPSEQRLINKPDDDVANNKTAGRRSTN